MKVRYYYPLFAAVALLGATAFAAPTPSKNAGVPATDGTIQLNNVKCHPYSMGAGLVTIVGTAGRLTPFSNSSALLYR